LELDCNESIELEVEVELQLSIQEKLTRAKEMNSKSQTTGDGTSIVKKEFAIFEIEGKRGANLDFY
jgi:hypothetical protein